MQEKEKTAPETGKQEAKPQETKKETTSWQDMKYERETTESDR